MRPAFSLIFFTSLSGLGFGLATVLGFRLITAPSTFWWLVQNGVALGLIGAGLLSSTVHLGHPERAWRALSQWKTSWLSREGVLASLAFGLLFFYALDGYLNGGPDGGGNMMLGMAVAVISLVTIWCTAMIYASLKTVARWHHPLTPFVFIGYAMAGGLVLAAGLDALAMGEASVMTQPALLALLVAAIVAMIWSRQAGAEGSGSTPESATGLGELGPVRLLMSPHSEENWLQHEMGFIVARKHADTLRRISLALAILLPVAALLAAPASALVMVAAVVIHLVGVMVSRWLFFAEAKHTVMLYYGQRH